MRILLLILVALLPHSIKAQLIQFKIDGLVKDTNDAKFAYLSTLSQQIPISSDKLFMMVPIVNGKFEFRGSFDLEGKNIQQANIFFDNRGNITKEELALKFKNLIWVTGRDSHLFRIILEDMSLLSKSREETDKTIVIRNGTLTKHFYEYTSALRARDLKKLVDFIKTHSSSPISLISLQSFMFFNFDEVKKLNVSIHDLFDGLSSEIKKSKDGVNMKKKISTYKN